MNPYFLFSEGQLCRVNCWREYQALIWSVLEHDVMEIATAVYGCGYEGGYYRHIRVRSFIGITWCSRKLQMIVTIVHMDAFGENILAASGNVKQLYRNQVLKLRLGSATNGHLLAAVACLDFYCLSFRVWTTYHSLFNLVVNNLVWGPQTTRSLCILLIVPTIGRR